LKSLRAREVLTCVDSAAATSPLVWVGIKFPDVQATAFKLPFRAAINQDARGGMQVAAGTNVYIFPFVNTRIVLSPGQERRCGSNGRSACTLRRNSFFNQRFSLVQNYICDL